MFLLFAQSRTSDLLPNTHEAVFIVIKHIFVLIILTPNIYFKNELMILTFVRVFNMCIFRRMYISFSICVRPRYRSHSKVVWPGRGRNPAKSVATMEKKKYYISLYYINLSVIIIILLKCMFSISKKTVNEFSKYVVFVWVGMHDCFLTEVGRMLSPTFVALSILWGSAAELRGRDTMLKNKNTSNAFTPIKIHTNVRESKTMSASRMQIELNIRSKTK